MFFIYAFFEPPEQYKNQRKPHFDGAVYLFIWQDLVGGLAWLCLRRTRNVFAAFYLQTQTRRRTKPILSVSPNTINHVIPKTKIYGWIRSLGTMCRLRATRNDFATLSLAKSTWFRTGQLRCHGIKSITCDHKIKNAP